jgi:gliding motility-associated-like protein
MKVNFIKVKLSLIVILFSINSNSQVVLNELMVRPPGLTDTPPNGLIYTNSEEYIELYNNSCSPINISGYFIAMKQNIGSINTGGTFRIPNVPAAIIPPGGHVVFGSAGPAGSAIGNIDIPITAADRCLYNGNFVLANTDGWCALYNASGIAIDCVYWSSSASKLTSNASDFNPTGGICLPPGSPTVTLKTPFQINATTPSIVRYGGPNPSGGNPLSRQQDGSNTWVQNLAPSIAANNCNGGTCVTPPLPPAPTVISPVNYCQGATAVPLTATPSGGTLNWYGTSATGGTASPTPPTPSTATLGPTTYYVSQTVGGCESPRAAIVVNVNTSWSSIISCGTSTASSVTFIWTEPTPSTVTGYSISYQVNSGSANNIGSIGNVLTYTVNSLNSGDNVTITVTPLGGSVNCYTATSFSCSTINSCPTILSPSSDQNLCLGGDPTAFSVNTTFTGNNAISFVYFTTAQTGSDMYSPGTVIGNATPSDGIATFNPGVLGTTGSLQNEAGTYYVYAIANPLPTDATCRPFQEIIVNVANSVTAGTLSGTQNICIGQNTTFTSNGTAGGTWSSSNTAIATVTSTGLINGLTAGTATITYTVTGTGGCPNATATRDVTVTAPVTAGTLSGTQNICVGGNTTFTSNGTAGGAWSSSNTAIATVNTAGLINGLTAGTATITYTVTGTGGCPNATATRDVTVTAPVNAGTLSGTQNICIGQNTTFTSNGNTGGAWSSSNTSIATVSSTGLINGLTAGTATITYTVTGTGGCPNATATRDVTVTAPVTAGTLSGTQNICVGGNTTFTSNGTAGGAWSSSNTAIATVNTAGLINGLTAGTATITYTVTGTGGCPNAIATRDVVVTAPVTAGTLSGTQNICIGSNSTFTSNGTAGGAWSSSNTAIATVNTAGLINGLTAGTATITYTVTGTGGCTNQSATRDVTVTAPVNAGTLSGTQNICVGQDTTFTSNGNTGGTWSSSNTAIATVSSTGLINGLTAGTATITYTVTGTGGCPNAIATRDVVVTAPVTAGTLSGTQNICIGGNTTFTSNGTAGGTWSSSNTAIATVSSTGLINGLTAGTTTITYTVTGTGGCPNAIVTRDVVVTAPVTAGTLSGTQNICIGQNTTFTSNGNTGGTWSSSNTAIATVSSTGLINGLTAGTATITYTVTGTGGCPNATATRDVTVTAPVNAGTLSGTQNICIGSNSTFTSNGTTGGTWSSSNTAIATVSSTGLINGLTAGTATITYTVTGTGGCTNQSATRDVVVTAPVTAGTLSGTQNICIGGNTTFTSNGTTGGTWSSSNTAIATVSSTGLINGLTAGTATITYTVTGTGGCTNQSATRDVVVTGTPAVPTIVSVAASCSAAGSATISNYNASNTYTFSPAGPTVGSGGVISSMIVGTSYTVTAGNVSCTSLASTIFIINAQPVTPVLTYSVTNTVCNGSTLNYVLTSNVPMTTFSWSATVSNISGFYSTTTNGNETNINNVATLTNPESIGTITMVIIPRANGCDGTPQTVIITVNPNPVVEVVAVADTSVCSATSATNNVQVNISGNISGITYNWTAITNEVTVVGGTTSGIITATSTTASFGLQVITSNPIAAGTIYFEVSSVRNGCIGNTLQSGVVTVNPNPGLPIPSPIKTICSGNSTDLVVDVSPLITGTQLTWEVVTVVNAIGAAQGTGLAPVTINDVLTATTNTQGYVIYRVRSTLGDCKGGYTDYRVNVNPSPRPVLTDGNICITATGEVYQNYTLNSGLNDVDYDFEWFDTNGTIIPGATNSTLVVDAAGTYSVIATNWLTGCSSDPLLSSATATVTATTPATTITIVQSDYFSNNATITVNVTGGTGTLIYFLDDGPLQSSNVFTGVTLGEHLVTVIDTEGCTYLTQKATIIDFPRCFSPNGDGINDTWNIIGLNQADAKLYIFDRYGKLIKQLSATDGSYGWDGTYNNVQLPSTDYWFTLDYIENGAKKQFKSHFSLKR